MSRLIELLKKHEGIEYTVYKDTMGIETIGVGRNLVDVGISEEEVDYLLANDIVRTKGLMDSYMPWHRDLDEVRQEALINFVFNVGIGTAMKFKKGMASLEEGDYTLAAEHMLDSAWAEQVGKRAIEITQMIETGDYQ